MVKTAKLRAALRRPRTWIIAVPVALIALALVVPFVYTHYLVGGDNPEPLSFEQLSTSSASAPKPAVAESTAAAAPPPVAAPPAAPSPP
ncbi:MAG: hypothetical protein HOQ24_07815, partial [Mycobacteriaceae bacterium]|nr:hypothetical protein [Mycobacteriaceae bacterium]